MAEESGPTTAGSIVAKLKMDRDQWIADMAETKADARELGALNPSIHIDDNVPSVLAQLEAVKSAAVQAGIAADGVGGGAGSGAAAKTDTVTAAERRLAVAVSAADTAYARAALAQMKLDAARANGKTTAIQLASAELAASEAMKQSESANEKVTLSEEALAAAQRNTAKAALEKAAAEEVEARASIQANEANKTSASRIGLIATAVAVLLPLLGPVAGFAIGGAGALAMMGSAGFLAILGIRNEMAKGTQAGNEYSAGLRLLKGDLDELSKTSAVAMLGSYIGAIWLINADMPSLNRQVNLFAGLLGQSGTNLLTGALNGLRVLEPLFISVGGYVDGLTAKFARWTSDGGLQKFGNYALSVLPTVEQFLGQVGTTVVRLLQAMSSLGTTGMSVFGVLFTVINALPVQVLADLIAGVTWGALAFRAWGFIPPLLISISEAMGGLGIAVEIAEGPIGWIIAGVGALVAVMAVSAASTQHATTTMQDYTAAVQADTGAIGENVKAKVAQALLDDGAYGAAKKLGIGAKTLTDATLGNAAAIKSVNAALAASVAANGGAYVAGQTHTKGQIAQELAIEKVRTALNSNSASLKDAVKAYNTLQEATGGSTITTDAQTSALKANAAAAGVSVSAYLAATSSQKDAGSQYQQTTALMYLQNDAGGLLKQTLDALNGKKINSAQAQNQFDSQLANMSTHMDETGKVINRADTLLTGMTASAVANRGELINLTQAAENNAQAFRDNGGSAEDTRQKLIAMKQAIIDNAVAHGEDRDQVQQYVDTLFKIPATVGPTQVEFNAADALAKLDALKAKMDAIVTSINIRANVTTDTNGAASGNGKMGTYAGGGTIKGLADGGNPGGTVYGPGTPTSDSVLTRLSVSEEVIRASSAGQARPFLKAFNDNPTRALSAVAAAGVASASAGGDHNELHFHQVVGDGQAVNDGFRRLKMLKS